MERAIISVDGDEREVESYEISEFGGSVFLWHEPPMDAGEDVANILLGDYDYEKVEGATIVEWLKRRS